MTIYIAQVLLILLLGLILKPGKAKDRKRVYLLFVYLMLVSVSGFRAYSVGADTKAYVALFENVQNWELHNPRFELGFMLYVRLLHLISDNPGILLVTTSALCIGVVVAFIMRFSKEPVLSLALYILLGGYFGQMTAMRQELAAVFSLIAFGILLDSRRSPMRKAAAGIMILLATSFHTSAMVEFFPYVLILMGDWLKERPFQQNAWKTLLVSLIAAVIGFVAYPIIMILVAKVFPRFEPHFHGTWSDANYNAALFKTLVTIAFAIAGALVFKNRRLDRTQGIALMMLGFCVIFSTLSMRMEIWGRLSGYFGMYTFLLWTPEFVSVIRNRENYAVMKACILLFSAAYMLIVLIFRPEWSGVVPYLFRR